MAYRDSYTRWIDKLKKRANKKAKKAARKNAPPKPVRQRKPNDGFYLCRAWRELRYQALVNCGARCMCCGAKADDNVRLHVDHIKPRSRYPKLELVLDNLQVLCEDCNIGKGAWDTTDFRPFVE
jgi:5-methylcytosine-specific restriction endonuclease McrA